MYIDDAPFVLMFLRTHDPSSQSAKYLVSASSPLTKLVALWAKYLGSIKDKKSA